MQKLFFIVFASCFNKMRTIIGFKSYFRLAFGLVFGLAFGLFYNLLIQSIIEQYYLSRIVIMKKFKCMYNNNLNTMFSASDEKYYHWN